MIKTTVLLLFICVGLSAFGQNKVRFVASVEDKLTYPLTKFTNVTSQKKLVRYSSAFTNFALKGHYKLGQNFHFSLNTGLYNQGMIHNFNDLWRVKQRAYIIPLGAQFTVGESKQQNIFAGAEFLVPFHYKEKAWLQGDKKTKVKTTEWFSDEMQMLSPVIFLGVQYNKTNYVQIKYQFGNFLSPNAKFDFRNVVKTSATQSNIIEVSFGTIIDSSLAEGKKKPLDDSKDVELGI